jgi:hypothetical protein
MAINFTGECNEYLVRELEAKGFTKTVKDGVDYWTVNRTNDDGTDFDTFLY